MMMEKTACKKQDERHPKQKEMPSYAEAESKKCNTVKSNLQVPLLSKRRRRLFYVEFYVL